ncbi:glycerophosphodiester phosphodiesterase family protein [Halalkalibacter urbisdiaboli]|uniref:glycerophosphodiester phosphodiesterase family protein n=1 Tax=Halalkalibacter urbisdiaboli TaxID=1960589 RepID=UPI000B44A494|nr:glycerophosphodiester phosphodiesterase family protein [Halalkalibacter urbisdiaboli]
MDMTWLLERPIAHRGYHSEHVPENSLAAFYGAIQEDFIIELDVRLLKDGEVVVFHDENLQRMTGRDKKIRDCTYAGLKKITLRHSSERIPLLKEVLDQVNGKVPLLIEIKNKGRVGELESKVVELLYKYNGVYAIQSFNPLSISWFKRHAPTVIRGQIAGDLVEEKSLKMRQKHVWNYFLSLKVSKPHFISNDLYTPMWLLKRFANFEELIKLGWTAKTQQEYERGLQYFDNIIFEGFHPLT